MRRHRALRSESRRLGCPKGICRRAHRLNGLAGAQQLGNRRLDRRQGLHQALADGVTCRLDRLQEGRHLVCRLLMACQWRSRWVSQTLASCLLACRLECHLDCHLECCLECLSACRPECHLEASAYQQALLAAPNCLQERCLHRAFRRLRVSVVFQ